MGTTKLNEDLFGFLLIVFIVMPVRMEDETAPSVSFIDFLLCCLKNQLVVMNYVKVK